MSRFRSFLAALALALPGLAASVSIELDSGSFRVTGLSGVEPPGGWRTVFAVYAGTGDVPPMIGSYTSDADGLVFTPRFPLAPGVRYRAVFRDVERVFDGPAPASSPTARVDRVYPTAGILPSNQLKFYIYFSAPMQRGGVWDHIRLQDDAGRKVNLAFLEIEQELWDPENRRLTVLFDPARIKRGVTPQMETGSAITEGRRYTLLIDKGLRDARGAELTEDFRKDFTGGPSVRTPVDPKAWKITAPAARTREPLAIEFRRPLDYALLEHVIRVRDFDRFVEGSISIGANETRWSFTPAQPWHSGEYELLIEMTLEDIAGNRIGRPFDVDAVNQPAERISAETMTLPFKVR